MNSSTPQFPNSPKFTGECCEGDTEVLVSPAPNPDEKTLYIVHGELTLIYSAHSKAKRKPKNWRLKRKRRRKIAKASRRRNRTR